MSPLDVPGVGHGADKADERDDQRITHERASAPGPDAAAHPDVDGHAVHLPRHGLAVRLALQVDAHLVAVGGPRDPDPADAVALAEDATVLLVGIRSLRNVR